MQGAVRGWIVVPVMLINCRLPVRVWEDQGDQVALRIMILADGPVGSAPARMK